MLQQGYWIMPNSVLFSKEITDKQKLLYCLIASLCAEEWYCRASNDYLWEKLWAKRWTISKNVSELEGKGFIEVVIEDNHKRKITLVNNHKGVSEKSQGGMWKITKGVSEKSQHNNIIEYNNIIEPEISEENKTNTLHAEDKKQFEKFWNIYPHARKSKKSDAKKFFKDQDSAEVLKEATLLRYKIEFGIEDSRYLPACERWIRDFVPSADVVVIDNLKKIMKLVAEMPVGEKRSKIVKDFSESYWKSVVDKVFKDVNSKRLQTIER